MRVLDLIFRKQRRIEEQVHGYLDEWEACLASFMRGIAQYLDSGTGEEFSALVNETHAHEASADDIRRKIEYEMYARALLPESRGDILGLLENLDRIPNRAETILFILSTEHVDLPREIFPGVARLVEATDDAVRVLAGMARRVFSRNPDLMALVRTVDAKESECDGIKRELVSRIAASGLGSFEKVTIRGLILGISELSDEAENIAGRIMIMSLKRKV